MRDFERKELSAGVIFDGSAAGLGWKIPLRFNQAMARANDSTPWMLARAAWERQAWWVARSLVSAMQWWRPSRLIVARGRSYRSSLIDRSIFRILKSFT